jgi:hypothetical protein
MTRTQACQASFHTPEKSRTYRSLLALTFGGHPNVRVVSAQKENLVFHVLAPCRSYLNHTLGICRVTCAGSRVRRHRDEILQSRS